MKRVIVPSVFILLLSLAAAAAAVDYRIVAGQASGAYGAAVADVAVEAESGDTFVTGYFTGLARVGDKAIQSRSGRDAFVARYDAANALQWVQTVSGTGSLDEGAAIVLASDGVYVAGRFSGEAVFGPGAGQTIQSPDAGVNDVFVAKYGLDGLVVWVRNCGAQQEGILPGDLAADEAGNLYLTGSFFDSLAFSGLLHKNATARADAFVAKFAGSDGALAWAASLGAELDAEGNGIAVSSDQQQILVTGRFAGTANFAGVDAGQDYDMFVAAYDAASGSLSEGVTVGGGQPGDETTGQGISAGADGSWVVSGSFSGEAVFGADTLESVGGSDGFAARYADGQWQFAVAMGTAVGDDDVPAAAIDSAGGVYAAGSFALEGGGRELVALRYDADGTGPTEFRLKEGGGAAEARAIAYLPADGDESERVWLGAVLGSSGQVTAALPSGNHIVTCSRAVEALLTAGTPGDLTRDGHVGLQDAIGVLQLLSGFRSSE